MNQGTYSCWVAYTIIIYHIHNFVLSMVIYSYDYLKKKSFINFETHCLHIWFQLVRRPGGMTAWVASEPKDRLHQWTLNKPASQDTVESITYPDDVSIRSAVNDSCPQTIMMQRSIRAARMRHASLDLADNMEVVIWDPCYNKSRLLNWCILS